CENAQPGANGKQDAKNWNAVLKKDLPRHGMVIAPGDRVGGHQEGLCGSIPSHSMREQRMLGLNIVAHRLQNVPLAHNFCLDSSMPSMPSPTWAGLSSGKAFRRLWGRGGHLRVHGQPMGAGRGQGDEDEHSTSRSPT